MENGDKSNTRFVVENGDHVNVFLPDYTKISRFSMGDRLYRCMPFKSANTSSIGGKASVEILEVLYESPKIAAYLAYAADRRGLANPSAEYVIHKMADNDMISLTA